MPEYSFETTPETYAADIAANLASASAGDARAAAPAPLTAAVEACLTAAALPAGASVEVHAAQSEQWLVVRVAVVNKAE